MWQHLTRTTPGVSRKGTYFENLKLNAGSIDSFFVEESLLVFLEKSLPLMRGVVLDVGCGNMKYKPLVLQSPQVVRYSGLDLLEEKYMRTFTPDLTWDGTRMPLEDHSVDTVLLFEVLEHCEHPGVVLGEIKRVLKPDGLLIFSVPLVNPLHGLPFDFQRFTPLGIKTLLAKTGFETIHTELSGSLDASLGYILGLWVKHRAMPALVRKIARKLVVLPLGTLFWLDRDTPPDTRENTMAPSVMGHARPKK